MLHLTVATILSFLNKIRTGELTINMPKEYENVPYHTTQRLGDEFSVKSNESENEQADILLTGFIISIIVFISS
jgi:hypothetical protein